MNILLDTHIALWALADDERLSPTARELIENPNNSIYWSVVSMWEIAIKYALKPEKIPVSATEYMHYCAQAGYTTLDVKATHISSLETLSKLHTDPFDRMLVAQAISESLVLLSHDEVLGGYSELVRIV